MIRYKFINQLKSDPVYFVRIVVSAFVLVAAIGLTVARPLVLHKFVLPSAEGVFFLDGVITQGGVNFLNGLLIKMVPMGLLLGCLVLCYSFIWRYFSLRLPASQFTTLTPLTSSVSSFEVYSLSAVIVIALVLRLHGITRGLTYDEIFTAMHFVEADSMWKTVSSYIVFNNHIAYSILARFSQAIFARYEWALRLPALLLGVGSLYCFWIFGRRFAGPKFAILATFGLALSPAHVIWSESARGYTGMILFTLISSHLYFKLLHCPTRRDGFKFILASVIGIYFHLCAAFVTVVQILFLLYLASSQVFTNQSGRLLHVKSFRTLSLSFAAIVGLSLSCYAPVFPQLIQNITSRGHGSFQPLFPLRVIENLPGSIWAPLWAPLGALVFLVFLFGLISFRTSHSKEVNYFTLLFLLPVLTAWLSRPFDLHTRFFVYFLPYYVLLLVSGFFTLWHFATRRHGRVSSYFFRALCTVLAVSVLCTWTVNSWNNVPEEGFRDAIQAMQTDAIQPIALCAIGGGAELFQYYSETQIFVPRSREEFQQIVERYPEIRCAYRKTWWEPAHHTEIGEFLSQNADLKQCQKVTVFIYGK